MRPSYGVLLPGAGVVAGAAGAGAGVAAAGAGASGGASMPPTTDPGPFWPQTVSVIAPMTNSAASTDVARVSNVAPERAPNTAWLLPPPNALAICLTLRNRTTSITHARLL